MGNAAQVPTKASLTGATSSPARGANNDDYDAGASNDDDDKKLVC